MLGVADVKFEDNTIKVHGAIEKKINVVLEECASSLERKVKRRSKVDTGQTKGAWSHYVDADKHEAVVGNPLENAIWEEFGTGEYADGGNGRKGGWSYKDEKGKWHHTYGKKPKRTLFNTFKGAKNAIINHIQESFKEL